MLVAGSLNIGNHRYRSYYYTFTLASDDGSVLFIDGQQVIDNSGARYLRPCESTPSICHGADNLVFSSAAQLTVYMRAVLRLSSLNASAALSSMFRKLYM